MYTRAPSPEALDAECIGGRARARVLDTMPTAHLPTPANLPNLNAKSAGATSVCAGTSELELGRPGVREGKRGRKGG